MENHYRKKNNVHFGVRNGRCIQGDKSNLYSAVQSWSKSGNGSNGVALKSTIISEGKF